MAGSHGTTHGGNNNDHSLEHAGLGSLTPRMRELVRHIEHSLGESVCDTLDKINDNFAALCTHVELLERHPLARTMAHDEPRVEDLPARRTPPAARSWADEVKEEDVNNYTADTETDGVNVHNDHNHHWLHHNR